jgi:hypothetical protein
MSTNRSWAGQVARNRARNEQLKRKAAAERTVIEAARNLERLLGDAYIPPGKTWDAWEQFTLAIEALEEVEHD